MKLKVLIGILLSVLAALASSQSEQTVNQTDKSGRKQGHWIRKYPNGNVLYEGFFRDDKPVGEFRRFYENNKIKSVLVFSENGTEAIANLYYENGYVASKGKYVNQLKEGLWQFFSVTTEGMMISEEEYHNDERNGISRRFYPDSTVAEVQNFRNDRKHGEWLKFYPGGALLLRTVCSDGKLHGKFEAFYENGQPEILGEYKNDLKEGVWLIYNKDGTEKFKTEYNFGKAKSANIDIYETEYIDSLEKNRIIIADPEKTGKIW